MLFSLTDKFCQDFKIGLVKYCFFFHFIQSGPAISRLYRQSQSRSSQNPSIRRGTQARGTASTRMAQLRSRFLNQSPTISSRQRNLHFPLNMDLDMVRVYISVSHLCLLHFPPWFLALHGIKIQSLPDVKKKKKGTKPSLTTTTSARMSYCGSL